LAEQSLLCLPHKVLLNIKLIAGHSNKAVLHSLERVRVVHELRGHSLNLLDCISAYQTFLAHLSNFLNELEGMDHGGGSDVKHLVKLDDIFRF